MCVYTGDWQCKINIRGTSQGLWVYVAYDECRRGGERDRAVGKLRTGALTSRCVSYGLKISKRDFSVCRFFF